MPWRSSAHRTWTSIPAPGTTRATWPCSVPSAMVFVPCEKGISHNEAENAKPEDLAEGARVIAVAIAELAGAH